MHQRIYIRPRELVVRMMGSYTYGTANTADIEYGGFDLRQISDKPPISLQEWIKKCRS